MSPKKATHSHLIPCTQSQAKAAKQAASNAGMNVSEFIRLALRGSCAAFGVDYPDDLPGRGKYDRSQIDWQKLADDQQETETQ